MKAAFVKRCNHVRIDDVPVPQPSGNKILVKIEACGVCGSDFIEARVWAKDWKRFGHEMVGTVAGTGPDVAGLSPGDQVVIPLSAPCGSCLPCTRGNPRKCIHVLTAEQGGFGEFVLIDDPRLLHKVSPRLTVDLACLAEPLTVVLDAFDVSRLCPRDHLVVVGGGFIAKLALLAAKAHGLQVAGLVSSREYPEVRECLRVTGGEHFSWRTIWGRKIGAPPRLKASLSDLGGRVVVLHSVPARLIGNYLSALPYDSTVVNIGLSHKRRENRLKLDFSRLIFRRLQLLSAFPVPSLHMPRAVQLLQEHQGLFALLAPERKMLDDLPGIIRRARRGGRKVLIVP